MNHTPEALARLYVVMAVHNRIAFTRRCLHSLASQTVRGFHVIVVDDGSTDGTGEMIAAEYPATVVLRGDGNLWWSKSMNLGVRYALDHGAGWILSINDDTIAPPEFVEQMLLCASRDGLRLIGALGVDAQSGAIEYGGERLNWWTARFRPLVRHLTPARQHGLYEVTHAPGRGVLIPAEVFDVVGLYDAERFPQTVADYDLTLRARRAGYRVYCCYEARLLTLPGESATSRYRVRKSLRHYWQHLTNRSGGGNVVYATRFALANCPRRCLPVFLPMLLLRSIGGYLIEWAGDWLLRGGRAP